jgi:hypothetical protein
VARTLTREQAQELARQRWAHDNARLDEYIDRLIKRSAALTPEQRDRIATLLRGA